MPAYVVVQIAVEDPVRYAEYRRIAPPSIAAYGGRYLVRGGAASVVAARNAAIDAALADARPVVDHGR